MHLVIFWLPSIVALVLWIAARHLGDLSPRALALLGVWYLAGFGLQTLGSSLGTWLTGLLMHVAMGVYLAIVLKVGSASVTE